MAEEDLPAGGGADTDAHIRTFLIADVRGYTIFTQERGDEAAAALAGKFATVAREGVEARGGTVVELRGDEALAVFDSGRKAIRAAVELQQRGRRDGSGLRRRRWRAAACAPRARVPRVGVGLQPGRESTRVLVSGRSRARLALDLDELIRIARENVTRELSDDECRQYLHVEACS